MTSPPSCIWQCRKTSANLDHPRQPEILLASCPSASKVFRSRVLRLCSLRRKNAMSADQLAQAHTCVTFLVPSSRTPAPTPWSITKQKIEIAGNRATKSQRRPRPIQLRRRSADRTLFRQPKSRQKQLTTRHEHPESFLPFHRDHLRTSRPFLNATTASVTLLQCRSGMSGAGTRHKLFALNFSTCNELKHGLRIAKVKDRLLIFLYKFFQKCILFRFLC